MRISYRNRLDKGVERVLGVLLPNHTPIAIKPLNFLIRPVCVLLAGCLWVLPCSGAGKPYSLPENPTEKGYSTTINRTFDDIYREMANLKKGFTTLSASVQYSSQPVETSDVQAQDVSIDQYGDLSTNDVQAQTRELQDEKLSKIKADSTAYNLTVGGQGIFTKTGDYSIACSSGIVINGESSGGAGIEFGNTGGDTHKIWYNPASSLIECDAYFNLTRRQLRVPEGQGVDFNGGGGQRILWNGAYNRFRAYGNFSTSNWLIIDPNQYIILDGTMTVSSIKYNATTNATEIDGNKIRLKSNTVISGTLTIGSYLDGVSSITVSGLVDTRDISADGIVLDAMGNSTQTNHTDITLIWVSTTTNQANHLIIGVDTTTTYNALVSTHNYLYAVIQGTATTVFNRISNIDNHLAVLDSSGTLVNNKLSNHDDHFTNVDSSMTNVNASVSSLQNSTTNHLPITGGTMTGNINIGRNNIFLVGYSQNLSSFTVQSCTMVVVSAGVGIGTTKPELMLDVQQEGTIKFGTGTAYRVAAFYAPAATMADKAGIVLGYDTSGAGIVAARTNASGQALSFWTYTGASWGERGRFSKTGNFGIGTTNPPATLSVVGTQSSTGTYICTGNIWVANNSYSVVMYDTVATTQAYKLQITNGVVNAIKW